MFNVVNWVGFIIDDRTDRLKIFELVSVNDPSQWCSPAPAAAANGKKGRPERQCSMPLRPRFGKLVDKGDALMFKKVAFTYSPVTDVARARKFYEETLGLKAGSVGNRGDNWWVEYDLPGG